MITRRILPLGAGMDAPCDNHWSDPTQRSSQATKTRRHTEWLASNRMSAALALGVLLAGGGPAVAAAPAGLVLPPSCAEPELENPRISVVFHATDNDAQLLISAGDGGSRPADGMTAISITGPRGTVALNAVFVDGRTLGQSDVRFDTPEPSLKKLRRAYPPGNYQFVAISNSNCTWRGTASLSYALLPAPVILGPLDGDTNVPSSGFTATWEPIPGAETVRFAIEDEDEKTLTVDLPGDATQFDVPSSFLKPDVLYTMDVVGINSQGNRTVVDVRFTTGP